MKNPSASPREDHYSLSYRDDVRHEITGQRRRFMRGFRKVLGLNPPSIVEVGGEAK